MYFIQSHNNPFITLPAIVQITGSDRVCCPNAPPAQHLGMGATTVAGWVPCSRAASSALQNMTSTHGGGTSHATLITAGKSCSGCCRVAEQREMWIWWPWHWARNQGMLIMTSLATAEVISLYLPFVSSVWSSRIHRRMLGTVPENGLWNVANQCLLFSVLYGQPGCMGNIMCS